MARNRLSRSRSSIGAAAGARASRVAGRDAEARLTKIDADSGRSVGAGPARSEDRAANARDGCARWRISKAREERLRAADRRRGGGGQSDRDARRARHRYRRLCRSRRRRPTSIAEAIGAQRVAPKPLQHVQPQGPSFTVQGHEVRWQKWRFRFGVHPREGLVIHTVGYEDEGRVRPDSVSRVALGDARAVRGPGRRTGASATRSTKGNTGSGG